MAFTNPMVGATVPGPDELGTLRLERGLGAGAFGVVFEASAERGVGPVAIKFVHSGALASPLERQALANEVAAAREVQHDHVLRVLFDNLVSLDYPPYTVSEFANGGRLLDKIGVQASRASTSRRCG